LRAVAVPVLAESLDRAISLAASMDSRGYGRRAERTAASRRVTGALVLAGLMGAVVGTYQAIDPAANHRLGAALLVSGTAVALVGGLLGGRRTHRTRYRPDPWQLPEWLVVGSGLVVVLTYRLTVHDAIAAGVPLAWPHLPVAAFLATLVGAAPAFATPPVPDGLNTVRSVAAVTT
jgi:energy-coupling factor transport system permease protein